jgi:uncharacterized protein (TIGR02271 family)
MARKRRKAARPTSRAEEVEPGTLVRHEEALEVGKRTAEAGKVRARKSLATERVERSVPVEREFVEVERLPAEKNDSGRVEELPDGSVSVPVFGEEIEVRKRVVVKERVRLAKRTVTDEEIVAADIAREEIEIDADPGVEIRRFAKSGPADRGALHGDGQPPVE